MEKNQKCRKTEFLCNICFYQNPLLGVLVSYYFVHFEMIQKRIAIDTCFGVWRNVN